MDENRKGSGTVFDIVLVGGGPRAVATIERLDARIRAAGERTATVAVVDAIEVGAGATWRTDQSPYFLNNTTSNATTIYPDESTPMDGPQGDGPTFVQWAAAVVECGEHEVPWVVAEAREVRPGSFPSRRLQGVYYNDQLDRVSRRGGVLVTRILGTVVDVSRSVAADERSTTDTNNLMCNSNGNEARVDVAMSGAGVDNELRNVTLEDGQSLAGRTVVLAQGMVQALPTQSVQGFTEAAARHGLLYIAPGMPAEQPWHLVPAGQAVIAQGLGANFFDVVAELTAGRGGVFNTVNEDPHGRLRYVPSGAEPVIFASSRRGVPYRSKGDYGNTRASRYEPKIATIEWFDESLAAPPHSVDFSVDLWPTLAAELGLAWVTALELRTPGSLRVNLEQAREQLVQAAERDVAEAEARSWPGAAPHVDEALHEIVTDPVMRFRVDLLRRPTLGESVTPAQWLQRVLRLVEDQLDSLANPLESPHQAVSRAMGASRGRVSQLAVRGVLTPESEVRDVQGWFNADGLFLASGPPASRVREVLALIEAGVVKLIGPETRVVVDESRGRFHAVSSISGVEVTASAFIETRMSKGKVPSTSDPLLQRLLNRGAARIHSLLGNGRAVETESVDAVPREAVTHPLSLVDSAGEADPRVLVLGIPAQSTQPGSAIGASPGVPSPLLAGADRAAAAVLAIRARALQPSA